MSDNLTPEEQAEMERRRRYAAWRTARVSDEQVRVAMERAEKLRQAARARGHDLNED